MLPKVCIVGRPNVGKSSLLNMLAGRRISIVDATAGVTRDRVGAEVTLPPQGRGDTEHRLELIDTGGYGIYSGDAEQSVLTADVERQIAFAVDEADLILFVVDAQSGIVPLDEQVARLLRQKGDLSRVLLVANKADHESHDTAAVDAMRLGLGEPLTVSATTKRGKAELIEAVAARLTFEGETPESEMLLAIVGKRNAGKSTLVNTLAGANRVIASEVAGTTRDSVDVRFEIGGRSFTAIDTAGVRKRKSIKGDVDYYALHRALRSVRRADAVLFLVDATEPVSQVDKRLSAEIVKHHKPCVVVLSKWDLVRKQLKLKDFDDYLQQALRGLDFAPVLTLSSLDGEGVKKAVLTACELVEEARTRVGTGELNRTVKEILEKRGPSSKLGTRAKIYYVTMPSVEPPTIALFVNNPDLFDASYRRYMINRFRERLPFKRVPIKLLVRARQRGKGAEAPEIAAEEE